MIVDDKNKMVESVSFWWHSIDLGGGTVTPGVKTAALLARELETMNLPPLAGKSVLDIGAWDGFFSFAAEDRGARKVVALDHFTWSLDLRGMNEYWKKCQADNVTAQPYESVPGLWHPESLPGKKGFDTCRNLRKSAVESIVADFTRTDLDQLGQFDIVFYLGVLYHMQHPFQALQRLAQVTTELAIIETEAVAFPGMESIALCEFYETTELNHDSSNWWAPSERALVGMARAAGFRSATVLVHPPALTFWERTKWSLMRGPRKRPLHYRAVIHAWK